MFCFAAKRVKLPSTSYNFPIFAADLTAFNTVYSLSVEVLGIIKI